MEIVGGRLPDVNRMAWRRWSHRRIPLAESAEILGDRPSVSSSPALGKGVGDHLDELARKRLERPARDSQQ